MNCYGRYFFLIALLVSAASLIAQEDPNREMGLPTRIGGTSCNGIRPGANATVQGTFNVTGMQNIGKPPTFSVAIYASGAFIARQRVRNGGAFYFYCVPDRSVFLVAEVNSTEVSSVPVGSLDQPPQTNYQDIYVTWSAARDAIDKQVKVISARNAYERSKENQKRFDRALDKLQENNGQTSLRILTDIVNADPKDFVAWSEIGTIQSDNRQFTEAEASFQSALNAKPDYVNALFGIGRAALALKDITHSIKALSEAFQLDPKSADVNHFLGEAYLQNKQGTLAIQYMRRAIELSPVEKAELHLRIAWLYNAAGAKDLAAEEYRLFLEKRPDYADKVKLQEYIAENSKK
jgi:Tfp pilus assembly protein PilF